MSVILNAALLSLGDTILFVILTEVIMPLRGAFEDEKSRLRDGSPLLPCTGPGDRLGCEGITTTIAAACYAV